MRPTFSFVLILFLVAACSSAITQQQAAHNAEQFLYTRGKFFSNDSITNVTFTTTDVYKDGSNWNVGFLVQGYRGGTPVSNTARVIVDKNGEVVGAMAPPK
jgi:hypothetical protein